MNRREFLQGSLGATIAAPLLAEMAGGATAGDGAQAQGQAPRPAAGQAPSAATTPRKLILDVNSRNLQWLRKIGRAHV